MVECFCHELWLYQDCVDLQTDLDSHSSCFPAWLGRSLNENADIVSTLCTEYEILAEKFLKIFFIFFPENRMAFQADYLPTMMKC